MSLSRTPTAPSLPTAAAMDAAAVTPVPRGALVSLSLAMLLSSLGTSIANVALPTLAQAFAVPFQQVQWVVVAYLLSVTALIVSAGRLGDLLGRRRLLLAGLSLFTAASLLCAVAPALWLLVAARTLQGLGAAAMMALTLALVGEVVPSTQTGRAMGLLGTLSAIGTALGPTLGGLLIAQFGWRALFLVNLPLGLLAWLFARHTLPADRPPPDRERKPFDATGTLLLVTSLTAYALAVTLGRNHFGAANLALLAAALGGTKAFLWVEKRTASPLVALEHFRAPGLFISLTTNAIVATVLMATLVVGPFYLSRGLGLATAAVGLAMSVGPVVTALTGVPAGRLADRVGSSRLTLAGLGGVVVGCVLLASLPARLGVAGYLAGVVVTTASYACFQTANNTAVMANVAPDRSGVISGLLNLSRNLGLVTGATLMGALFALGCGSDDVVTAAPAAVAAGLHVTFAIAAGLAGAAFALQRARGLRAVDRPR